MRRGSSATASSGGRRRLALAAHDPATLAFGERVPARVFTPKNVKELAAFLRDNEAARQAVVFFGGGTMQSLGFAPQRYDVAVDLRKLAKIVEYEVHDLTVAVEAGCDVASFSATLAKAGQFVPLDAPLPRRTTIGGLLASGWSGPRRATYGRPRDLVIGTSVVLADGTIVKAGGMVVKNSTGYDLSKLYCGSLGTLGAIVRANFKTLPLPQTRRFATAALPEHSRLRAIEHVAALEIEPSAAFAITGFGAELDGRAGPEGRIAVLFEGSRATVDRATRDLRSALGAAGVPETTLLDAGADAAFQQVVDAYLSRLEERSATYRSTGFPSELAARSQTFSRLARSHDLELETIGDIRTGDLIARVSCRLEAAFADRLPGFDDALTAAVPRSIVLVAPAAVRDRLAMWGNAPPSIDAMRALKDRFDPNRSLAPGRFVARL